MLRTVRFLLPALGLLGLVLAGCDMAEPERAHPDTFVPPEVGAFSALDPSRHYAGLLPITVTADLAPFPIAFAGSFVGGRRGAGCGPAPCTFHIQTDAYPDGLHEVALVLQKTHTADPELGLLNLVGAGGLVLTDTFVFDQRPPTPPRIDSVSWTAEGAWVHWSSPEGTNRNARSVTLFHALDDDAVFDHAAEADAASGSILDPRAARLLGLRARYVVGVWNGRGHYIEDREMAYSDTVASSWSPFFAALPSCFPMLPFVAHAPGTDPLLVLCGDTVWGGSIAERRLTASAPVPVLTGPPDGAERFLVPGLGGAPFYVVETRWESQQHVALAAIDPLSLAVGPVVHVELPVADAFVQHVVADGNGRVYLVSSRVGRVFTVDAATGAVVESFAIQSTSAGSGSYFGVDFFITPDGRRLIRAGWDVVQSVDLAQSPPQVTATRPTGIETHFGLGADVLYVASHRGLSVEVLDVRTLESVRAFSAAEPGNFGIRGVWSGPEGVYVETGPTAPGDGAAVLTGYTPLGQRFGTWPSASPIHRLFSGASGSDVVLSLNGGFAILPPSP